jgi:hypothetical protein
MEILDASDNVVRTYKDLKAQRGLSRFSWDLNHEPPEKIKNAVISLSYTGGPKAVPGLYKVRFTAVEEVSS